MLGRYRPAIKRGARAAFSNMGNFRRYHRGRGMALCPRCAGPALQHFRHLARLGLDRIRVRSCPVPDVAFGACKVNAIAVS